MVYMSCYIINLEGGLPTVSVARSRLVNGLQTARMCGSKTVKIVHGYGSSGKGGAIKRDTHIFLAEKMLSGAIKGYVKGEDFSPFCEASRKITALAPELKRDHDYDRGNDGITIVLL